MSCALKKETLGKQKADGGIVIVPNKFISSDKKMQEPTHCNDVGHVLYLEVENDYINKPVTRGKFFQTVKKDSELHGWGTQIVEDIVKNYEGDCEFNSEDSLFTDEYIEKQIEYLNSIGENIISEICKYSLVFCKEIMKYYPDVDYPE